MTRGQFIVVAGQVQTASGATEIGVARYTPAGRQDPRFGKGGLVETAFPGGASAAAVVVDPQGRIVVAGSTGNDFALARYTPTGRLDGSFGSSGRVTTAFPGLQASGQALVLLPGGGIVVAGGAERSDGTREGFALVRYDSRGRLYSGFGDDGRVFTGFGTGADVVSAHAVAFWNGKLGGGGTAR